MKVTLPDSLEEITIAQFKKLMELTAIEDEKEQAVAIVGYFCNLSRAEVLTMHANDFEAVVSHLMGLTSIEKRYGLERFITMGGVEYGFHPNLKNITVGEFADLEQYCGDDAYQHLEAVMSILYRPVKEKHGIFYTVEPYEGAKPDKFMQFPFTAALGALAFFLTSATQRQAASPNSSKEEKAQASARSGAGTRASTTSLEGTFSTLRQSLK